jgi:hypothetical protein
METPTMRKTFSLGFLLLASTGCSKVDMRPTMEADPAEVGVEGLIFINELARAYETGTKDSLPFCDKVQPSYQESGKHSYRRYDTRKSDGSVDTRTEQRFGCLVFKKIGNDPAGKELVLNHLRAGFALSDLYCKNFFRRVATNTQKRGFARNNVNDVGTAVAAILGLAKSSSGVAGGIGAGFGLADNVFRTYDQQFLISPDFAYVQKRVLTEQANFALSKYKEPPTNYFDASIAISDHANLCSYVGMKRLINDSLSTQSDQKSLSVEETAARFIVAAETVSKAAADERARREEEKNKAPVPTPSPAPSPSSGPSPAPSPSPGP